MISAFHSEISRLLSQVRPLVVDDPLLAPIVDDMGETIAAEAVAPGETPWMHETVETPRARVRAVHGAWTTTFRSSIDARADREGRSCTDVERAVDALASAVGPCWPAGSLSGPPIERYVATARDALRRVREVTGREMGA